jgi:hypothetical protein
MEQKQIKTILSAPCAFESNRSQACFYLVENGNQILSIEESINLTSTTIKPEKRLFKLYEQYRVINIEVKISYFFISLICFRIAYHLVSRIVHSPRN